VVPAVGAWKLLFTVWLLVFSAVSAQWLERLRAWNMARSGADSVNIRRNQVRRDAGSLYPATGEVDQN